MFSFFLVKLVALLNSFDFMQLNLHLSPSCCLIPPPSSRSLQCTSGVCLDTFELDPNLSNSTNQGNMGPVKPPADPDNPTPAEIADQQNVFFEGTLFWHGGDQKYICGDFDQVRIVIPCRCPCLFASSFPFNIEIMNYARVHNAI